MTRFLWILAASWAVTAAAQDTLPPNIIVIVVR